MSNVDNFLILNGLASKKLLELYARMQAEEIEAINLNEEVMKDGCCLLSIKYKTAKEEQPFQELE